MKLSKIKNKHSRYFRFSVCHFEIPNYWSGISSERPKKAFSKDDKTGSHLEEIFFSLFLLPYITVWDFFLFSRQTLFYSGWMRESFKTLSVILLYAYAYGEDCRQDKDGFDKLLSGGFKNYVDQNHKVLTLEYLITDWEFLSHKNKLRTDGNLMITWKVSFSEFSKWKYIFYRILLLTFLIWICAKKYCI